MSNMNNEIDAGIRGRGRRGRPPSANAMTAFQRLHRHRLQLSRENRDAEKSGYKSSTFLDTE